MKILITSNWYNTGVNGVATSVKNLENGLKALGADVRVLTLSPMNRSYTEGNVTYIRSLSVEKIYPEARISELVYNKQMKELVEWKPDVIHSQCEFSPFTYALFIARHANCPIVHTYHTVYEDYTHYVFHHNERLGKKAVQKFTQIFSRHVNALIAPTDKVRELLIKYGCHTPIWVMPTGLDLDKIAAPVSSEQRKALKQKYNIPSENKIVLYAGRLAEEKNLTEIVEYIGNIHPEKTTLLIVGDGPARPSIEEKIKECGISNSVMTGMIDQQNMHLFYSIADFFVSASRSETQGLTYIEALANGVPLLCRLDKCLDGVLVNGKTGYAYNNEEDFARYFNEMLTNDISEMSQNAVKLVNERYSIKKFAENALEIYQRCINNFDI